MINLEFKRMEVGFAAGSQIKFGMTEKEVLLTADC